VVFEKCPFLKAEVFLLLYNKEEKMKRFWLVLLSLGLVMAFSVSAWAVDVKFSGSFYAAGMYLDKTNLVKADGTAGNNPSTAFYFQRLRVQTDFIVSPGLTLITRFDALERAWGAPRSSASTSLAIDSAGTTAENENIAFDWAYINYQSPIGIFDVGIMNDGSTGTIFGNSYAPAGRIKYSYPIGPVSINAAITKVKDQSFTAKNSVNYTDADQDKYGIEGVYGWKGGKAGIQVNYYRYADKRPTDNYTRTYFLFTPYVIAKIGPVDIEAEVNYALGQLKSFDNASLGTDVKLENLTAYIKATATFSPIYFGGIFAYISGDDPGTTDKQEGGTINGGRDWNPCLIMFNYYDRTYWVGGLNGYNGTNNIGPMGSDTTSTTYPYAFPGAWFGQGIVGVRPVTSLDIMASVSYAQADKKPAGVINSSFGWEVDVTGTYKITNNLSYMLGVGYWLVGEYYKGSGTANELRDNYMVINKLTLTF
jgi:hypothetical protein